MTFDTRGKRHRVPRVVGPFRIEYAEAPYSVPEWQCVHNRYTWRATLATAVDWPLRLCRRDANGEERLERVASRYQGSTRELTAYRRDLSNVKS